MFAFVRGEANNRFNGCPEKLRDVRKTSGCAKNFGMCRKTSGFAEKLRDVRRSFAEYNHDGISRVFVLKRMRCFVKLKCTAYMVSAIHTRMHALASCINLVGIYLSVIVPISWPVPSS